MGAAATIIAMGAGQHYAPQLQVAAKSIPHPYYFVKELRKNFL
jgi:hypothetical protein